MSTRRTRADALGPWPAGFRELGVAIAPLAARAGRLLSGMIETRRNPPISIARTEHRRLGILAMAAPGHDATASDALNHELDRARVVPDGALRQDVVRMGSIVTFRRGSGETERVAVVYPPEADEAVGKVSILSPLGAALIGLGEGQTFEWMAAPGRRERLTVISVLQPRNRAPRD